MLIAGRVAAIRGALAVTFFAMAAVGEGLSAGAGAQDGAAVETPAAVARAGAHDAIEALRSEIRMLNELRDAQEALLRWNRLRDRSGEPPASLDGKLCEDVRHWCAALPATFGRSTGVRP